MERRILHVEGSLTQRAMAMLFLDVDHLEHQCESGTWNTIQFMTSGTIAMLLLVTSIWASRTLARLIWDWQKQHSQQIPIRKPTFILLTSIPVSLQPWLSLAPATREAHGLQSRKGTCAKLRPLEKYIYSFHATKRLRKIWHAFITLQN